MIVYNAGRSFFALKHDAEQQARALQLPKDRVLKITIEDRDQLAALLNAMVLGDPLPNVDEGRPVRTVPIPETNLDFIPKFIQDDWKRRAELRKK
jgi:hypothetical protein